MVTLKSHGTRDGDVAVDLDHRDVVRGKWTQARTWRDLDPQTHYRHSPGAISYPPKEWGSVRSTSTYQLFHTPLSIAVCQPLLSSSYDRQDPDGIFMQGLTNLLESLLIVGEALQYNAEQQIPILLQRGYSVPVKTQAPWLDGSS